MHGDDGIVLRLPDLELEDLDGLRERGVGRELLDLVTLDPDDVRGLVTEEIGGSALFAARFRECAARALLLPRRQPNRRQPLWQQRQRASQLLEVASQYPSFPIVLEAVRECVQDVFDVPGLVDLMRDITSRRVVVVDVESSVPSPFAKSLLFGYVAQFLYEGDSPLAERRAAALALDPSLLAELLGTSEGLALRDLLDAEQVARTEAELQRLTPERAARDADDVLDLLRSLGPVPTDGILARSREGVTGEDVTRWLADLAGARQVIAVRVAGEDRWSAIEDASRLRDALGVSLPPGVPQTFLEPVVDPLGDLVARYARTHVPFHAADVARAYGLGIAVAATALSRLMATGRVVEGELLPTGGGGTEFCDAEVLRMLRRRSLAALRAEVEPVTPVELSRFLLGWQGVGGRLRGREGLLRVVEQLSGAVLPASAIESLVLPSRVVDYSPGLLDELMATGEVLWCGHGSLPGDDGWLSLHLADSAHLTLPGPDPDLVPDEQGLAVLDALAGGGAHYFRTLSDHVASIDDEALSTTLWDLVWSARVTGDTFAPVRALLAGGRTAHRRTASGPRRTRYAGRRGPLGGLGTAPARPSLPSRGGPPRVTGRWSLLPPVDLDPTQRAYANAELLLDRHGILTRGATVAEDVPGGFAALYRVLARAEEAGRVRRGYFVEGLGASQFGTTGAVDRLRSGTGGVGATGRDRASSPPAAVVLAASDPANPYGAALPWPDRAVDPTGGKEEGTDKRRRRHQPGRKAGAVVVLVDGDLVLYVERGGRTLLTSSEVPDLLRAAAGALADAVRRGSLGRITVEKADGGWLLGSDHPVVPALEEAGFHLTPRGLRMRR
ncbi:MAG TPA: DEAD/DEAH box helicase, partial [Ornithinibacter sp.]|nr:DEAD/DEAH box helicase [Ornithinibacter sp.]